MTAGYGFPAPGGGAGRLRASDADRDRVAAILGAAYREGRLSLDEYDDRLHGALSARTYADLDQLVSDLPVMQAAVVTRVPEQRGGKALAGLILWAALILAAIVFFVTLAAVSHTSGPAHRPGIVLVGHG